MSLALVLSSFSHFLSLSSIFPIFPLSFSAHGVLCATYYNPLYVIVDYVLP